MKGKMKKSLLSLALLVCMLMLSTLTAFAAKDVVLSEEDIASFKESAVSVIENITALSDEDMEYYLTQGDDFAANTVTSWKNAKEELGAYVSVGEQEIKIDGTDVTIISDVTFELKTASVELIVDTEASSVTSMVFNVNYTMGEKMTQAGLNTVMGIAIVFLMLLFLSWLIGLFKHVSKLEAKLSGKQAAPAPAAKPAPVVEAAPAEEEELSDDEELVAVIAAAIAAYEGTGTDGFVVRSIKKSSSRKWKRA